MGIICDPEAQAQAQRKGLADGQRDAEHEHLDGRQAPPQTQRDDERHDDQRGLAQRAAQAVEDFDCTTKGNDLIVEQIIRPTGLLDPIDTAMGDMHFAGEESDSELEIDENNA